MSRVYLVLLIVGLMAPAHADPKPKAKKVERQRIRVRLQTGARYAGSTTVSYTIRTRVTEGERESSSTESVQRTERFVDNVVRAGDNGLLEIKRNYLRVYSKTRDLETGRPNVRQSPMQGRSVVIRESRRKREVVLSGRGSIDSRISRTAGMELDWRDVFPEEPVGIGDTWSADARRLARRLAVYLKCGTRSTMKVKYEEDVVRDGSRQAKLYVDWTVEGMRDRRLFTKVTVAGDVYYDFAQRRVVHVDVGGSMIVRGAYVGKGKPRIVKGEGPVSIQTTVNLAPIRAAAGDDDEEDE